ncbi:putative aminoadipate reductase [Mycena polygramma]|nr:putative aminoadipate reductase [Mycena polygramma]
MSAYLPPLDCSLSFDEIIDQHIAHENRGVAFSFSDEFGHVTDITHLEFARAAHRVAHLLRPQRCGPDGQVVGIVALTDVLIYQTIVVGCIKAGLVPFQISPRNSEAAVLHLLSNSGAHRVLMTRGSLWHLADTLASDASAINPPYELAIEEIPLLGQIYPHLGRETTEDVFVSYPSPPTRTPLNNVLMYLHSSGNTGFPKCIPETSRNTIHYAALGQCFFLGLSPVEISPRQAVGALSPFHALGMITQLALPILNGGTACIYPPASTATKYVIPPNPTPETALENAKRANATGIAAVPATILEWQSSEHIAYLKTLKLVLCAGGSLAYNVGDSLFSQGVNIVPWYGATEFGGPCFIKRRKAEQDAGEWAWLRFSNRVNVRWEPQGDGTFECQLLTVPETHQVSVENLPDVMGYATKDLFERHPTKPDLYKVVGRLDDVLIMANGEKTVPGPMEDCMVASPFIAGAVMFGRERNQVGVLIEPSAQQEVDTDDDQQVALFRNSIWPVIQNANENAPAFARIYKEMILLTHPGRPMARTPKGTVVKKSTIASYEQEIEELYETIEASGNATSDIEPPSSWIAGDLENWLKIHATLVADREIRGGHDLFEQGFDSLNATFLRHRIVGALKNSGDDKAKAAAQRIPQNLVYAHPSIGELAGAITTLVHGEAGSSDGGKAAIIEKMIAKYSEGFGDANVHAKRSPLDGIVVLLTGSTGGLGSHMLHILLNLASVERVYAFNRRGRISASERQLDAFNDRGLDVNLISSKKFVYLEGDTSRADLGLPSNVWTTASNFNPHQMNIILNCLFPQLRDTVGVIIHNAWTLDFNKSLSSFEPQVKGTRNLIDLALRSPNVSGVRFLFTSSIGSAQGWDQRLGPFPEELQLDANVAVGNGYGESKYIVERILAASGLDATSFRIGQIRGSTSNGSWSTSDWVPAIVKSSIALGNFPSDPSGVAAWLSPESVSHAIVDAALSIEKPPFAINLVHPRPVPWDRVMSAIARDAHLPLVPFPGWVEQLQVRSVAATTEDLENIPAIKLLDFFKVISTGAGNIGFSTLKAQSMSGSMRSLKPFTEEDASQWMKFWRQKKFIV